jgi:hypothetical protein
MHKIALEVSMLTVMITEWSKGAEVTGVERNRVDSDDPGEREWTNWLVVVLPLMPGGAVLM